MLVRPCLLSPLVHQIIIDKADTPLTLFIFISHTALRIHVSQSTINILQRTDCHFEYEPRGETFLKVRVGI